MGAARDVIPVVHCPSVSGVAAFPLGGEEIIPALERIPVVAVGVGAANSLVDERVPVVEVPATGGEAREGLVPSQHGQPGFEKADGVDGLGAVGQAAELLHVGRTGRAGRPVAALAQVGFHLLVLQQALLAELCHQALLQFAEVHIARVFLRQVGAVLDARPAAADAEARLCVSRRDHSSDCVAAALGERCKAALAPVFPVSHRSGAHSDLVCVRLILPPLALVKRADPCLSVKFGKESVYMCGRSSSRIGLLVFDGVVWNQDAYQICFPRDLFL